MNPYLAYKRVDQTAGATRIDLLLSLFDGAIDRLDKAEAVLKRGGTVAAVPLLSKTQLIISALAGGVRLDVNEEMGTNMLRLYEFAVNELREPRIEGVVNARKVLMTLREGFDAIRTQAVEMERSGQVAVADKLRMVHATA